MPKAARINAIKSYHCYTVSEAADIVGVTTKTIQAWGKSGLVIMSGHRPHLIRGDALKAFIRSRREARKKPTEPHTFFCLSCGDVREAAGGFAECSRAEHRVTLKAICATCGGIVNKPISNDKLADLEGKLELLNVGEGVG